MRLLAVVLLLGLATTAAAEECAAAVTAERRAADKLVKAGDAAGALAKLEALQKRCTGKIDKGAELWLVSDMAFAAHSAGKDDRCVEIILALDDDAASANLKAAKALLYNAGLCSAKEEGCDYKLDGDKPTCKMQMAVEYAERNELTGFTAPACTVAKHQKAVALPDGRCLEATGGKESEDDVVCPTISLVDAKGKRKKLAPGAWLEDQSDCCTVRSIKVKAEGGKLSVLFGSNGPSRDCFGGTATHDFLTLFKLVGDKLEAEKDYTVGWH